MTDDDDGDDNDEEEGEEEKESSSSGRPPSAFHSVTRSGRPHVTPPRLVEHLGASYAATAASSSAASSSSPISARSRGASGKKKRKRAPYPFVRIPARLMVDTHKSMSYGGQSLTVYRLEHYFFFDFHALFPLMKSKGLMGDRPPGASGPIVGSAALEWLTFTRDTNFPWTPRCATDSDVATSKKGFHFGREMQAEVFIAAGVPYVSSHGICGCLLWLAHLDDDDALRLKPQVQELEALVETIMATEPAAKERLRGVTLPGFKPTPQHKKEMQQEDEQDAEEEQKSEHEKEDKNVA